MKWPLVTIAEAFEVGRGGSPRPIDAYITDDPDGINWIMIGDATEGLKYITGTKKRIRKEGLSKSRAVKSGDFLLTNSMSFGKPYILQTAGCIHDGWLVLTPRTENVHPDFFYHLLGSPQVYCEFERLAAGATVKNLNSELVRNVKIPLPPMEEQQRIAAILDQAEALRAKRRQALAKLDTLLNSTFDTLFGKVAQQSGAFEVRRIDEVCELIVDCVNRTAPLAEEPTDYKMIRTSNVKNGKILLNSVRYVSEETFERWNRRASPLDGDVILTREAPVGEVGLLRGTERVFLGQRLMLYRAKAACVLPEYLTLAMKSAFVQDQLRAGSSGSTVKHLPLPLCRSFEIPVPPVQVQEDFTRFMNQVYCTQKKLLEQQSGFDGFLSSLQHRAFRGEL